MFWFCIAVVCQECSVLDYMALPIQCAELSSMYADVTLCSCLHVVKSARPSAPQGLPCSTYIVRAYIWAWRVFQARLLRGALGAAVY